MAASAARLEAKIDSLIHFLGIPPTIVRYLSLCHGPGNLNPVRLEIESIRAEIGDEVSLESLLKPTGMTTWSEKVLNRVKDDYSVWRERVVEEGPDPNTKGGRVEGWKNLGKCCQDLRDYTGLPLPDATIFDLVHFDPRDSFDRNVWPEFSEEHVYRLSGLARWAFGTRLGYLESLSKQPTMSITSLHLFSSQLSPVFGGTGKKSRATIWTHRMGTPGHEAMRMAWFPTMFSTELLLDGLGSLPYAPNSPVKWDYAFKSREEDQTVTLEAFQSASQRAGIAAEEALARIQLLPYIWHRECQSDLPEPETTIMMEIIESIIQKTQRAYLPVHEIWAQVHEYLDPNLQAHLARPDADEVAGLLALAPSSTPRDLLEVCPDLPMRTIQRSFYYRNDGPRTRSRKRGAEDLSVEEDEARECVDENHIV